MYDILELNKKLLPELKEVAKELNIKRLDSFKKQDLIYKILDEQAIVASEKKVVKKGEKPAVKKPLEKKPLKKVENTKPPREVPVAKAENEDKAEPVKEEKVASRPPKAEMHKKAKPPVEEKAAEKKLAEMVIDMIKNGQDITFTYKDGKLSLDRRRGPRWNAQYPD